jgi:hypothetical protein
MRLFGGARLGHFAPSGNRVSQVSRVRLDPMWLYPGATTRFAGVRIPANAPTRPFSTRRPCSELQLLRRLCKTAFTTTRHLSGFPSM